MENQQTLGVGSNQDAEMILRCPITNSCQRSHSLSSIHREWFTTNRSNHIHTFTLITPIHATKLMTFHDARREWQNLLLYIEEFDLFETLRPWAPKTEFWKPNNLHEVSKNIQGLLLGIYCCFGGIEVYFGDILFTFENSSKFGLLLFFLSDVGVFWLSGWGVQLG